MDSEAALKEKEKRLAEGEAKGEPNLGRMRLGIANHSLGLTSNIVSRNNTLKRLEAPRAEQETYRKNISSYEKTISNLLSNIREMTDHRTGLEKSLANIPAEKNNLENQIRKIELQIPMYKASAMASIDNRFSQKRQDFLRFWNDPKKNQTHSVSNRDLVFPDEDPLADFLESSTDIQKEDGKEHKKERKVYFFNPTPNGFYNQYGQSLADFMSINHTKEDVVVLPAFDKDGRISDEMIQVVRHPKPSQNITAKLPVIKFVETTAIDIGWKGYGLGELSHSFNLFPGEDKVLVVEKKTRLTRNRSETRGSESSSTRQVSSSFEENLQNEFSKGTQESTEEEDVKITEETQLKANRLTEIEEDVIAKENTDLIKMMRSREESTQEDDGKTTAWDGGDNESATSLRRIELEKDYLSELREKGTKTSELNKRSWNRASEDALKTSQSQQGRRMTNQSQDMLLKDMSNTIRKISNDTSMNNKVEISAVSSEEHEESTLNKETIHIQNPNNGKTINYNFYQIQNLYGTSIKLTDVKCVINTGVELIEGTGINDVKVFELEEFGKIFANSDGSDRSAILAAVIVNQVMKRYANFMPGVTSGNSTITVNSAYLPNKEDLDILMFRNKLPAEISKKLEGSGIDVREGIKDFVAQIRQALKHLKRIPFVFKDTIVKEEIPTSVNTGSYHVESQVGIMPATEEYLEDRRDIETARQRAIVERFRAQTKEKVFFPEIPDGVTHLDTGSSHQGMIRKPATNEG